MIICVLAVCGAAVADEVELRPIADTFVVNPGPGNTNHVNAAMYNYGGAGSRSVASATARAYQEVDGVVIIDEEPKGEFISLLKFDFSSLAGRAVSGIALQLYISNGNQSAFGLFNYIGSAGYFDMAWISNDWIQGSGAPHEMPGNSLNGISYNSLQELLEDTSVCRLDTFYYTAQNLYGQPQWFTYTCDLTNGCYTDLLAAVMRGETVTFMLKASDDSEVSFNFSAYVQNTTSGTRLRAEGPILTVETSTQSDASIRISNCYAAASVSGGTYVGGLIGYNAGGVEDCYMAGMVSGEDHFGGLAGQAACEMQNCFWDMQVCDLEEVADENALSTAEMMQQGTFAEWDFSADDGDEADWKMLRPQEDYPRLTWQEEITGDIAGLYGVDVTDLMKLTVYWLEAGCPDGCDNTDVNGDGVVDMADLAIQARHWLEGQ